MADSDSEKTQQNANVQNSKSLMDISSELKKQTNIQKDTKKGVEENTENIKELKDTIKSKNFGMSLPKLKLPKLSFPKIPDNFLFFSSFINTFKNPKMLFSNILSGIIAPFEKLFNSLTSIFGKIIKSIGNFFKMIGTGLKKIGKGLSAFMLELGKGLFFLAGGLAALANPLTIIGLFALTAAFIGFSFGIKKIIEGVSILAEKTIPVLGKAIQNFAKGLPPIFKGIANAISIVLKAFYPFYHNRTHILLVHQNLLV